MEPLPHDDITPTRERLLDTAAALFWEKGYAATTTREIAALVGIQQASLYYHVASKEDLLYQLGVSSLEQLRVDVQAAVEKANSPLDRIRAFVHAHLATLLKYQIRHVTVLTGLHGLSGKHRGAVLALRKNYANYVRHLLEDTQKAGVLRADVPPQYLYLALLNMLNWAVFWFRRDQASSIEQLAEAFHTIYIEGAAAPGSVAPLVLNLPRSKTSTAKLKPPVKGAEKSTPERMLERAAALFASKGYAATSTREIAAGLGMRKASLYYHIETKEDLLYAICESSLGQIRRDVESALASAASPLERVRILADAHVASLLRNQDKHSATLAEMHTLSRDRRVKLAALRDEYEGLVRRVLAEAQAAGALRGDIPIPILCLSLLGLLNRVVIWYRPGGSLSPEQLGQLMSEVFLNGVAARASTDRQVKSRRR